MKPIVFPETNATYGAPGCGDLPAWHGDDVGGQKRIISCWKLTIRDRIRLLLRGRLWMDVCGQNQPPIDLYSKSPFSASEKRQARRTQR